MAYLTNDEIRAMNFRSVGRNVKISNRASIYDAERIEIGDNSRIDDFCVISGGVSIGRNVHITVFCNVAGGRKGIILENFSTLAYGCQVFSQSDDYSGLTMANSTVPAEFKCETCRHVRISKHCIVGANSVIMPGVTLAEGTAVGAMSLVLKSTEPWSIYFGVPARWIRPRNKEMLEREKKYLSKYCE